MMQAGLAGVEASRALLPQSQDQPLSFTKKGEAPPLVRGLADEFKAEDILIKIPGAVQVAYVEANVAAVGYLQTCRHGDFRCCAYYAAHVRVDSFGRKLWILIIICNTLFWWL